MIGSILFQDLVLSGRRNRLHVLRFVYACWLILVLLFLEFFGQGPLFTIYHLLATGNRVSGELLGAQVIGGQFARWFVWEQTLLVYLAAPIFAADAAVTEKRSGNLQFLLLAEVEPWQFLLGKLVSRVSQVCLVLLAGAPLFALLAGFGGVKPATVGLLVPLTLAPAAGVVGLSLLASAVAAHTRGAVFLTYLGLVVGWVLVDLLGGGLRYLDPLWVQEAAWAPADGLTRADAVRRAVICSAAWLGVGAVSLTVGSVLLPRVYKREMESLKKTSYTLSGVERVPVSDHPVQWREQHVEGMAAAAAARKVPVWLAVLLISGLTALSSLAILYFSVSPGTSVADVLVSLMHLNFRKAGALMPAASPLFGFQGIVAMLLAALFVGVRAAAAVTQERERGTWEALLLTPISAGQIVRGKLWGIIAGCTWYLFAYAVPAVFFSALAGPLALTYTLLWLATTLLAMHFIGAVGLWFSVRSGGSWRSLLKTVAAGYLGGLAVYALVSLPVAVLAGLLLALLFCIDLLFQTKLSGMFTGWNFPRIFSIASAIGLALVFWLLANVLLRGAQRWIADRERTRHWYDEPGYRRSRIRIREDPGRAAGDQRAKIL